MSTLPDFNAMSDAEVVAYLTDHREHLALLSPALRKRLAEALTALETPSVKLTDLSIRTKDARLVPLRPNVVQMMLLDAWAETYRGFDWTSGNWLALRGARETILKARQEGVSTLVEAICYAITSTTPHWVSLIIADTQDRAELLFEMIRRFHQNDPRNLRTSRDTVRVLKFADLDSTIRVTTAGDPQAGRAATINFLHMSELAFWGDNWDVRGALLDAVPLKTGIIIEETTANGLNGFYEHYQASEAGLTNFRTRFLPWFALPEYSLPAKGLPSEEEMEVMRRFNVTHGQARWYCVKRREKATTGVSMEQEYPGTPEEAFVASASGAVFPVDEVKRQIEAAPEPLRILRPGTNGLGGTLEIYEEPQRTKHYVIGADVAEGITDNGNRDYSVMDVFRADTWEHVASYYGRPDLEHFASDLDSVAAYYNNALLVVERNNHGHAVLLELNRLGANVFAYKATRERAAIDGFPVTARSKAMRDSTLRSVLLDTAAGNPGVVLRGKRAMKELLTYHELPGKRRGAVGRAHDDHVAAIGMAIWYLSEHLPRVEPFKHRVETWDGYQPSWGSRARALGAAQ